MDKRGTLYITLADAREVHSIAREECSNIIDGKYCLLMDGLYCPVLSTSSYVACNFFIDNILVRYQELEESIKAGTNKKPSDVYRNCQDCGTSFISSLKNTLYCDKCRKLHRKETKRKYNSKRG